MKTRISKYAAAVLGAIFVTLQFLPSPPKTNPRVEPAKSLQAHAQVPPEVQAILERACQDCHSNRTQWPAYSYVAPVSWFVRNHVNHGRKHLNFSDWTQEGRHGKGGPEKQFEQMCEEVRRGSMPLRSYVLIHRNARLSQSDVETLCGWTGNELQGQGHDVSEAQVIRF